MRIGLFTLIFTWILCSCHAIIDRVTTTASDNSASSSTTTQPKPSPTSVWATHIFGTYTVPVTITKNGVPVVTQSLSTSMTVTQSPYTQKFTRQFLSMQQPKSGSIGLGKWSSQGTVGTIKTNNYMTITQN